MKRVSIVAVLAACAVAVPLSSGSSHREAPNIMLDPTADNTDTYAFTAQDAPGTLTMIGNWIPGHDPANGPNFFRFDDRAVYYLNVDNTGDGRPDIRYRYTFRTHIRDRTTYEHSRPEVTSLGDPDLIQAQTYDVVRERYRNGRLRSSTRVARGLPVVPTNVGPNTMPDYSALAAEGVKPLPGGGKVFVGERDESFFIDLGATFDSVNLRVPPGNAGGGKDDFAGSGTSSIVMQVPEAEVTRDGRPVAAEDAANAVVGVWASTDRRRLQVTDADYNVASAPSIAPREQNAPRGRSPRRPATRGGRQTPRRVRTQTREQTATISRSASAARTSGTDWVQVSRLGGPLINELFSPAVRKDLYNRRTPDGDGALLGDLTREPILARIINRQFTDLVNAPENDREDLYEILLQGVTGLNRQVPGARAPAVDTLKINLGTAPATIPNRFGLLGGDRAGYPNGRRLEDDIVDIQVRLIAGFLVGNKQPVGDGVVANDKPFLTEFPYLAEPDSGFDSRLKRQEPAQPPDLPDPAPADGL